jgi:hypothetical protein
MGRARTVLLLALLGSASCPAAEPLAPLLACRAVADSAARLACFDREAAHLAGSPAPAIGGGAPTAAAPAPSVAATAPAAAPPTSSATASGGTPAAAATAPSNSKENFGLSPATLNQKEIAAGTRPAELKSIDAHIVSVSASGIGRVTFTLDNGQVWRQLSAEGDLLSKPGDSVTVSRGLFGSFWLQNKNGRGCKVSRIS